MVNNEMTIDFLHSAFGGESMAHMRYSIWAEAAEKEGFKNVSRLFKAVSYAEWVHARNHFNVLKDNIGASGVTAGGGFGNQKTVDNLQWAMEGELHEIKQMYPVYLEAARFQSEKDAERSFHFAVEAEKQHAGLYKKAREAVAKGSDISDDKFYVCPICGHTVEKGAPDVCPICGAKGSTFKEF